jgi:guanylate kinase
MDIDQLAVNYRPDQTGIEVIRGSRTLFLIGVMSAGKDTIKNKLLDLSDYFPITTYTTRLPRINDGALEQDGVAYHFVSRDQMAKMLLEHQMIEVNHFGNDYYGTSVDEFRIASSQGKIAVGNVDVNGVSMFYDIAPQNMTAVFVVPPSYEVWIQRVKKRYGSLDLFNKEWEIRRTITIDELEFALSVPYYQFVINDDLKDAVELIDRISHSNNIVELSDDKARSIARDFLNAIKKQLSTR